MLGVLLVAVAGSALLTGVMRSYALARSVLDLPNPRSLHRRPTPRGGGAAIVLVTLVGVAVAAARSRVPPELAWALLGGGSLVAGVGWLDDRGGVSARFRAGAHIVAAGWALFCLRHGFAGPSPALEALLLFGAGVWIAWAPNMYNFMDGIDGLAAGEAVCAGLAGGVLLTAAGRIDLALPAWLLGAAAAGFLPWNWPPARIFLGDVGSGFLGYAFATISVASDRAGAVPVGVWLLLLGIFVVDASVTLVRRLFHGDRWYEAHRSHAYQRLVRGGHSHLRITGAALLIDVGLGLAAWSAFTHPASRSTRLVAGFVLLALLYLAVERRYPMFESGPTTDHSKPDSP